MTSVAIPFPANLPPEYELLDNEPNFDPAVHLDLSMPTAKRYLDDFGYSDEEIATSASPVATSEPFRMLSVEGARVLRETARRLREHAIGCERIENMVRTGVYRSKFLRDITMSPDITAHLCDVFETDVAPHTVSTHLGHINFAPDDLAKAVDKWHHDTIALDYVMMVNDPQQLKGGEFEYFVGTRAEAKAFADEGKTPPRDRVVSPNFPDAGYSIALHGFMVVHRAAALTQAAERITMVNGYVPTAVVDDVCRFADLKFVDDPRVLYAEWARHKAWLSRNRLDRLINETGCTNNVDELVAELRTAISDVETAITDLTTKEAPEMIHYGG